MKKKLFIYSQLCFSRVLDLQLIKNFFLANGYRLVLRIEQADTILINTCGVTQYREDEAIEIIRKVLALKRQEAQVIIGGCLPAINKNRIESLIRCLTFSPASLERLNEIANVNMDIQALPPVNMIDSWFDYGLEKTRRMTAVKRLWISLKEFKLNHPFLTSGLRRFNLDKRKNCVYIPIVKGCFLRRCSYCATKLAVGSLISKPREEIVSEINRSLAWGYKDIVLVGEDTGSYGQEIGLSFPSLLEYILQIKRNFRITVAALNPYWLVKFFSETRRVFELGSRKLHRIHITVQSGSNKVLSLMNRGYGIEEVEECLAGIKQVVPGLKITVLLMVGFPGEEEDDFSKTLAFIKNIPIDEVRIFKYSDRPYTEAAGLNGKIPEELKEKRVQRLRAFLSQAGLIDGTYSKHY